jgi:hypothetical protein
MIIFNFGLDVPSIYGSIIVNPALIVKGNSIHSSVNSSLNSDLEFKNFFSETSSSQRVNRFNNILVNYDYKTGHYMGDWDKQYPYLINSLIEVARGIRKPT